MNEQCNGFAIVKCKQPFFYYSIGIISTEKKVILLGAENTHNDS